MNVLEIKANTIPLSTFSQLLLAYIVIYKLLENVRQDIRSAGP